MAGMDGTSGEINDGVEETQTTNHGRRRKIRRNILPLYS
jgi:hypothetical protein